MVPLNLSAHNCTIGDSHYFNPSQLDCNLKQEVQRAQCRRELLGARHYRHLSQLAIDQWPLCKRYNHAITLL